VPESAASSIWFDGVEYSSRPPDRAHIAESFGSDIVVEGRSVVPLRCTTRRKDGFLRRKTLITEIGRRLSKAIERRELHSKVQYGLRQLEEFVGEKTKELEQSKDRYKNFFEDAPMPMLISHPNGDITKQIGHSTGF